MSRKSSSSSYSWERSFSPQILSRGRNYYQNGAVSQLTRNAKGYTAVVEGTEDYCVEVEMEGSTVEFMDCDCPYAEDGNNCKHMAAVLYAIEALNEDAAPMVQNAKSSKKSVSESTEALIARIPEAELRSFLNKLCQDDERIERQLVLRCAKTLDASHLKQLRREFEQICQEYSDRHGFIDWERAADYELAVEAFLSDNTAALVERGNPMMAFQMICDALFRVGQQDIDDNGELTGIASVGYDCWSLILTADSPAEKWQVFDWFSQHVDSTDTPDYLEDTITDFYENEFQEPEFLRKKLARYQASDSIPSREKYHEYYRYEHNAVESLRLMEKLSYSEDALQAQIKKNYQIFGVRKFAAAHALSRGDTDKAICVLQESKELDHEYGGLVAEDSVQLIQLYEQLGRSNDYKQELQFYIFHCRQDDLVYIEKLKSACDEPEWEGQREQILSARTCYGIRYALLASEGLTERLLQDILRVGSVFLLDQYESVLRKQFPTQVRDAYAAHLRKNMPLASNRSQYAGLIRYLKKICRYPDGKAIAGQIAAEWRTAYPRRRAMLDELARAGF